MSTECEYHDGTNPECSICASQVASMPFSPADMEVAHANFNAMCGHGAFAAAMGRDVCHVMQYFPPGGGWVNIPVMESALRKAGKHPGRYAGWVEGARPALTILQFLGPWMKEGVPPAARCQHRHWVATSGRLVWDCNVEHWLSRDRWEERVFPGLLPKRATGWEVFRSLVW